MAGLFSGASLAPGNEAMGQAVGNLADILYKKLDEAEAVSQYHTGQQILSNMMNKFDLGLDQDPNWNGYEEKNNQAQEQAWQTAQSQMKNQTAQKELTNWWESQKLSRSRVITNKIVNARLTENQGRLKVLVDDTIANTGMTSAKKKARLKELGSGAIATNVTDKASWLANQDRWFKKIDQNDLMTRGIGVMEKQGKEAGIAAIMDTTDGLNLTEEERKSIASGASSNYDLTLNVRDKEATEHNNKIRDDTFKSWILDNKMPADAYAQLGKLDFKTTRTVNGGSERQALYELIKAKVDGHDKDAVLIPLAATWNALPEGNRTDEYRNSYVDAAVKAKDLSWTQRESLFSALKVPTDKPQRQEDEDAKLNDFYHRLRTGGIKLDGASEIEIMKQVYKADATEGAKERFAKLLHGYTDPEKSLLLKLYQPLPGASPEEIEIARSTELFGNAWLEKHPEVTDLTKQKEALDGLQSFYSSPYRKDAIASITTGDKIALFFKNDIQTGHTADMIQKGYIQEAADAGDTNAQQQFKDYMAKVRPSLDVVLNLDTDAKKKSVQYVAPTKLKNGLQPIASYKTQDGKTYYGLWKRKNKISWYSLDLTNKNADPDIESSWVEVK